MPPPPVPQADKEKPLASVFALPYRLFYAVACQDAVFLYDTQQAGPVAIFRGLHYAGFTDIAWSPDGQTMMLSSADGYCSMVVFDFGELGAVHPTQRHHRQLAAIAHSHGGNATPLPLSPSVATMRQSPAPPRSERESSAASSVPTAPAQPPLFARPPSSTSPDHPLPTPSDDWDAASAGIRRPSTESAPASVAASADVEDTKRPNTDDAAQPKKKRRVALNHLSADD
jgi:chromatin assembly factor 1 subunit B